MTDGGVIPPDIDLNAIDLYFKRSLDRKIANATGHASKFHPFGLNYSVLSRRMNNHFIDGKLRVQQLATPILNRIPRLGVMLGASRINISYLEDFENLPVFPEENRILYMTRAFQIEPGRFDSDEHRLNEFRAACIRRCKSEFGRHFKGGFAMEDYSMKHYADLVLPEISTSFRHSFLSSIQESSICIATTGLYGSIGWKMAEYLAASKAIVSEPLQYEVPGRFEDGRNYYAFTDTDGLASNIAKLIENTSLRNQMMVDNFLYYRQNVHPASVVLNSLLTILNS
jgi:hypothetical protein